MAAAERDVVADFWRAVDIHDWDLLASTIAEDFVRIGMNADEADTCRGKENYLQFVASVTGKMDHHDLKTTRIFYAEGRRQAIAECVETIKPPGEEPLVMDFVNLHELNEDGLISTLDIYWKTQKRLPPDWIAVESVLTDAEANANA
jgi:hypothetical protein